MRDWAHEGADPDSAPYATEECIDCGLLIRDHNGYTFGAFDTLDGTICAECGVEYDIDDFDIDPDELPY